MKQTSDGVLETGLDCDTGSPSSRNFEDNWHICAKEHLLYLDPVCNERWEGLWRCSDRAGFDRIGACS